MAKQSSSWGQDIGKISMMWLLAMGAAVIWVGLDRAVPAWDQAEHLSLAMNHWWLLRAEGESVAAAGWRSLWLLSPKYPPVFYLVTAAVHALLGPGPDQAMVANGVFALLLLLATYGLGRHLFHSRVGLIAAGLCLLMPRLIRIGLDYQLDYAVTALTVTSFGCLTVWQDAQRGWRQWLWIVAFGISFGLSLMTKQSAVLFLFVPLAWVCVSVIFRRRFWRGLQVLGGAIATALVLAPWLSVNWVFQFSIFGNTNVQSAQAEGDPMLNTLAAWTYYWRDLPAAVSWGLLVMPLVGIVFWFFGFLPGKRSDQGLDGTAASRWWLLTYLMGAYLLWSAVVNKDPRYVAPYLPALAIFLAWGLDCWWRRWPWVAIATLGVSSVTTVLLLFPTGIPTGLGLSRLWPGGQLLPYQGPAYPHPALIDHVANTQPYQISTIGGLQSTAAVNQHNISYYGKLNDYRVYGRQVGDRRSMVDKDVRSLNWFYGQGSAQAPWPPAEDTASAALVQQLEQRPDFAIDRTWDLPGENRLYLYRRQQLPVTVTGLPNSACAGGAIPRLNRVELPAQGAPGELLPVTYEWVGSWQSLHAGWVLLTWQPETPSAFSASPAWIHDHGIGLGSLRPAPFHTNQTAVVPAGINPESCFQVTERTATLPPVGIPPGPYRLVGNYFRAQDEPLQPLDIPVARIVLTSASGRGPSSVTNGGSPTAIAPTSDTNGDTPAAAEQTLELDWVTQLREASRFLAQGPAFLDEVFDPIGRINLYDPIQNYTVQAEQTLSRRWQQAPDLTEYGYGLVLSQILQLKVEAAIATLETLVERDAENPYAYAYLGFVNLYAFRPHAAQTALAPALELAPESPEIHGLSALAALFQGNLWGAWQRGRQAIDLAAS